MSDSPAPLAPLSDLHERLGLMRDELKSVRRRFTMLVQLAADLENRMADLIESLEEADDERSTREDTRQAG